MCVVCFSHLRILCLFRELANTQHLSIFLGKNAINDTDADREQRFIVEKLIVHKKYSNSDYNNDIGVNTYTIYI